MADADLPAGTTDSADGPVDVALSGRPFLVAWLGFWALMFLISLQDAAQGGHAVPWEPLAWEGSSCLVASALAITLWRRVSRSDALLGQPWRWFMISLRWLPLTAPAFVIVVFALRHGLYALAGASYRHDAFGRVIAYEGSKFALFYLLFAAIVFGLRSNAAMVAGRLQAERLRSLTRQAQVLQLTQQLEPHFLFNALNTIAATIHTDPALADTLLVRLATLLRSATNLARQPLQPLAREAELLRAYADIMLQRFAPRVTVQFDLAADALNCAVPTLLLQPLIENAFRHAVEQTSAPCTLTIRAQRTGGGRLRLSVENDGPGPATDATAGNGLTNLRQRLALLYGARAALTLQPRQGGGTLAVVEMPCNAWTSLPVSTDAHPDRR